MSFLEKVNQRQILLNFIFCSLGCYCCYFLQNNFSISNVLASILVGLAGSFLPKAKIYDANKAIASIYSGSFASMCSLSYFESFVDVIILCALVGFYFTVLSPFFRGYGGKLGSIAFFSSLSFILFKVVQ